VGSTENLEATVMSRVVSGSPEYRRKRPTCSITLNDVILQYVDELAKKSRRTRSDVIETALRLAMKDKQLERAILGDLAALKLKPASEDKDKAEKLSSEFMRRLIYDDRFLEHEWVPAL